MTQLLRLAASFFLLGALSSCGLFDSGVEWKEGPYELVWIDKPENISLYRRAPDGGLLGRVDATVFSVGWNGRYAVAKQQPAGDRSKTYYFIVDSQRETSIASSVQAVTGPLDEVQYAGKALELKLPEFDKTLVSLK